MEVSIHAPAGGATPLIDKKGNYIYVSIHAPAGGATFISGIHSTGIPVSIHAPAGGATCLGQMFLQTIQRFNPRARGGRDP